MIKLTPLIKESNNREKLLSRLRSLEAKYKRGALTINAWRSLTAKTQNYFEEFDYQVREIEKKCNDINREIIKIKTELAKFPIREMEGYDPDLAFRGEIKRLETDLIHEYPQLENLSFYLLPGNDALYLNSIRVEDEEQGKGIGTQVLARIIQFAEQHKLKVIVNPVPDLEKYREKLERFYRKSGFAQKSRGRNWVYKKL